MNFGIRPVFIANKITYNFDNGLKYEKGVNDNNETNVKEAPWINVLQSNRTKAVKSENNNGWPHWKYHNRQQSSE